MATTAPRAPEPTLTDLAAEVERLRAELGRALERETATGDVLRVIAGSPTNVQKALEEIASQASRLVPVGFAVVAQIREGRLYDRVSARDGVVVATDNSAGRPLGGRGTVAERAVLERGVLHAPDVLVEADEFPGSAEMARRGRFRCVLAVPLLRGGDAVGWIGLTRAEPEPFSEQEIALVQTFADQAVIAIENARLFAELQDSNRALTEQRQQLEEALEQQTATSEVLHAIASSPGEIQAVLDDIAERAARLLACTDALIWRREGASLRLAARGGRTNRSLGTVFPLDESNALGRAALLRRAVHVPDLRAAADEFSAQWLGAIDRRIGSLVAVPLLREEAEGVLVLRRTGVQPFSEREIAAAESFASQAVVAVENARLFAELERRLAEQTAMADVLRVIASSTDLTQVFGAIAERAAALCGATDASVFQLDGDRVWNTYRHGPAQGQRGHGGSMPASETGPTLGRSPINVIAEGRTIHIPETLAYGDGERDALVQRLGIRSRLGVPLLRDGAAVGCLLLDRTEPRPFTPDQIRLVESFADQAVIAIENARLFQELQESNATLTEALEQQRATSEILGVIASSPTDVRRPLEVIAEQAARVCRADDSQVYGIEDGPRGVERVRLAAWGGAEAEDPHIGQRARILPELPTGLAVLERRAVHVPDTEGDHPFQRGIYRGRRTVLAVPLLREDVAAGVMVLRRAEARPFSPDEVRAVESFAAQAAIALENARLFRELQERLEEQAATGEILRVIGASPTDAQPVFDAIVEGAVRVCRADRALLWRVDGDELASLALHLTGDAPPLRQRTAGTHPFRGRDPLHRGRAPGRAVLDRSTVHLVPGQVAPEDGYDPKWLESIASLPTFLAVPLLREGVAVGVLTARRVGARPFSPREIALVETFAAQAVIAMENARLFTELQESNATLKQALEQQTATSDVLRAIASSPADLAPVMDTILERAMRLCDSPQALVQLMESGRLRVGYRRGRSARTGEVRTLEQDHLADRAHTLGAPTGPMGALRVVREGRTLHIPDMAALAREPDCGGFDPAWVHWNLSFGTRAGTWLGVPMLRQGTAVGAMIVSRSGRARPYTAPEIALLETFAAQAAIAIENTRLFTELRDRDVRRQQELERASAIQQRLLPERVEGWPGVLEVAVRFRAAVETSGDFYDILRLTPASDGALPPLQFAVGDVAGKGMSAALVTALARSALRSTAAVPTALATPANILRLAGQRLHEDVGGGHFVACALAVVEPPGRHHPGPRLRLANAAQVPVLLVRGGCAQELEPPGYRLPLGAQDDGDYEDLTARLVPGDVVVFSSDGLVEAPAQTGAAVGEHLSPPAKTGELFGFERLQRSASHWSEQAGSAEAVAGGMWADLTAWCGEESHHDDVTLLVLRVPDTHIHGEEGKR